MSGSFSSKLLTSPIFTFLITPELPAVLFSAFHFTSPFILPPLGTYSFSRFWITHAKYVFLCHMPSLFISIDDTHELQSYTPPTQYSLYFFLFFSFIFISWRLITLQYCSGFCHTLKWISHGFTCIPHPDPPSHFPLHPTPLGLPSSPAPSTCLMHPTWAGDLFHHR